MSRGFAIGINVATADELTAETIAAEVAASGMLTAVESQTFLPAALVAAQALANAIGAGPYWVWLDGTDNLATAGETTSLVVRVNSFATASAPTSAESPTAPVTEVQSVEAAPNGEPAVTTPPEAA
jgi:hypothetical protein